MAYMKTKQSKKIRNINTVGVTFINVSAIGSAMCSLICLETKKKKPSFQLLLFKKCFCVLQKDKRSKYKHMFYIKVKPRRYTECSDSGIRLAGD